MRLLLLAVAAAGVAGMIVTSIADSPEGALVFGMVTGAGALALVATTAVTTGGSAVSDDDLADDVEAGIERLVASGADEAVVRAVVRDAVRFGRLARPD